MEKKLTKQEVIKKWQDLDRKTNKKYVGLRDVSAEIGVHPYHIERLFPEGLTEMKRKHDIRRSPQEEPYTPDRLLEKIDHIVKDAIPTWKQLSISGITEKTVKRLFQKTDDPKRDWVIEYRKWLKKNRPDSEKFPFVEKWLKGEDKPKLSASSIPKKSRRKTHVSARTGHRPCGKPLGFRNMIYEPTEEAGVVLLFGMVSQDLGYSIEGVWQTFPDCMAKRRVTGAGQQEPVMIEFQYKSKDFLTDGHDLKKCNVIVCWEDNWGEDSPIEVVELSKVIKTLPNPKR